MTAAALHYIAVGVTGFIAGYTAERPIAIAAVVAVILQTACYSVLVP